jgi:hypothetical protein
MTSHIWSQIIMAAFGLGFFVLVGSVLFQRRIVKRTCDLCGKVEFCKEWSSAKAAAGSVCKECAKMEAAALREGIIR